MGLIGRWVDEMCRYEPELMQQVHDMPWGPVHRWVDPGCRTGCLIGSCAIAMVEQQLCGSREVFVERVSNWYFRRFNRPEFRSALQARPVPGWVADSCDRVGIAVSDLLYYGKGLRRYSVKCYVAKRSSPKVEQIVKARIARRLAEPVPVEPSLNAVHA